MIQPAPFPGLPSLSTDFEESIKNLSLPVSPKHLYDPIRYFLGLGGKRFRPALHLLAAGALNAPAEHARKVALAIEVFHNFTLVHDDIMDQAPLRRGQETVHQRWNSNVAILSGDAMLVVAYEAMASLPPDLFQAIAVRFNKAALGVVEGQQMDMDFETETAVSKSDYLEMIRLKTAVLVGFSLEAAGILARLSESQITLLREAGEKIGIGFQLYDDYLDVFGDAGKVGKQAGGDIRAKKKTILFHLAMQAGGGDSDSLTQYFHQPGRLNEAQVAEVAGVFEKTGAKDQTKALSEQYYLQGIRQLKEITGGNEWSDSLIYLAERLMYRTN